jgi:Na+-driven multidrug efflux pump
VIGRKRTNVTLLAAIIELSLNIPLSLFLIRDYGTVGVALATLIVYIIEKIFLTIYVRVKMNIKPAEYIPLKIYAFYSTLLILLFVLIDHRIIDIH